MRAETIQLIEAPARLNRNKHDHLFLLQGDATSVSPLQVDVAPGITLPPPVAGLRRLKVLHFNDCHGRLTKITPAGTTPVFSRLAGYFYRVRREFKNDRDTVVLVLSAGDDQIGSTFDHLLGTNLSSFRCHAPYRLYSSAGVDLSVLGNHDLDMGSAVLCQALQKDARFPLLSANLIAAKPLQHWIFPAAIIVCKGLRIGVIGVSTSAQLRHPPHEQLRITDPVPVVQNLLPALEPHCDVMILLSHLGYSLQDVSAVVGDAGDVELASSLPPRSLALIVGGHTHHTLNETGLAPENVVNGIPIVQAGAMGEYLGEVDLVIEEKEAGVNDARLHAVQSLPVDTLFEKLYVQPMERLVEPILALPLGKLSYHPDLDVAAVAERFAAGESALANFFTDALVSRCRRHGIQVDIGMLDHSAIHSGLTEKNRLTFSDCYLIMPYADLISIYFLDGSMLPAFLEDNVLRFQYPGRANRFRGFFHFSKALRYAIRFDQGTGKWNAVDITYGGRPLAAYKKDRFLLATTSFARTLAQRWEKDVRENQPLFSLATLKRIDTDLFYREEMINYILKHGGINEAGGACRDGRLQVHLREAE